ncbi:MAG: hypothetical protein AAFR61_03065 [Bacteroidota bacterium]
MRRSLICLVLLLSYLWMNLQGGLWLHHCEEPTSCEPSLTCEPSLSKQASACCSWEAEELQHTQIVLSCDSDPEKGECCETQTHDLQLTDRPSATFFIPLKIIKPIQVKGKLITRLPEQPQSRPVPPSLEPPPPRLPLWRRFRVVLTYG